MLAHQQGSVYNAAQMARNLDVTGKTVAGYLDLMVDLLLVRRLPSFHANVKKRLVKSPKVYIRDSGLVHALLGIDSLRDLLGHPVVGMSWEGHVLENLLRMAPERSKASFYRTATGVEIDLVLELPGDRLWAIEIKRTSAPKMERGFRQALDDIAPERAFIVYGGKDRYPKAGNVEAISLHDLAADLAALK
jgi:predicted AAA+ superfamily ATPase